MLILLHGDDQTKSRDRLRELLAAKNTDIVYFDGKKLTLPSLILACESAPLLFAKKILVIENFFQGRQTKDKIAVKKYLLKNPCENLIVIWEDRQIDKAVISRLPKDILVSKYDFPENLFRFLDSLGLLPMRNLLMEFHKLIRSNNPELIFTLIVRQFRMLIMVKEENNISGIPDWQYYKFKKQSSYFSMSELVSNYRQLLFMDYRIKNGATPYNKKQLLDIFLANI